MDLSTAWNAEFIESQYQRWKADPASVSRDWRFFFEGFDLKPPKPSMNSNC